MLRFIDRAEVRYTNTDKENDIELYMLFNFRTEHLIALAIPALQQKWGNDYYKTVYVVIIWHIRRRGWWREDLSVVPTEITELLSRRRNTVLQYISNAEKKF